MSGQIAFAGSYTGPLPYRRLRLASLIGVTGLHAAGLIGALIWVSHAPRVEPPKTLSVSFLAPPQPEVKPPEPLPPAPPPPEPIVKPKPKPLIAAARAEPVPDAIVAPPPPVDDPAPPEPVAAYSPPSDSAPPEPAQPEPPQYDMAYLQNPFPPYPATSKRLREEGTVQLRVLVSETGEALSVDVEQSSGYARLDDAARRAVQRWKFVPSRLGDKAVQGVALVPIVFSLKRH